jgi:hypothetical protein
VSLGADVAGLFVAVAAIATVATVVSRDESGTINTAAQLGEAVIRVSFGKDATGSKK